MVGKPLALALAVLLSVSLVRPPSLPGAETGPVPPCAGSAFPAYPVVGAPLNVEVWFKNHRDGAWVPPACTGWETRELAFLLGAAGRFHHEDGVESLLQRIGAISQLTKVRYWSVTRGRWRNLFSEAFALAEDQKSRRDDFTTDELHPGTTLYYWQEESGAGGSAVYRLRIVTRKPDRLVVAGENVEPVRFAFLTLFGPREYQFWYVLQKESDKLWQYYGLLRAGSGASRLAIGHERSYVNRAAAWFRFLAGIPTDRDPPLAP